MARRIRIGKRLPGAALLLYTCFLPAYSQSTLVCTTTAVNALVRSEGVTEQMGDVVLDCSGGKPGVTITVNLTVFLTVNITNKLLANNVTDAQLLVDTGSGPAPANVPAQPFGANAVVFNGLSFTIPASGKVSLRITNLRGDANQLVTTTQQTIFAFVAFSNGAGLAVTSAQSAVAIAEPGLLAQFSSTGVRCTGSPLPATLTLANLFAAGTHFFSTRVTEGFPTAFQPKDSLSDTGARFLVQYSGFPAGARLFVPDFVAGSSALEPTAGGDLGLPPSGGQYAPSAAGSLLLVRVVGADSNGAGGMLAFPGPLSATSFDSVSELTLANGAAAAVYEVVDANPSVRESAQFPTFLGLAPYGGATVIASESVSFGPLSTVSVAAAAPVPRFANVTPQSDCGALGDCNAPYFPHLEVDSPPLDFSTAVSGVLTQYVRVHNNGGGLLNWTESIAYQSGTEWLNANPPSGPNNATIQVYVTPGAVTPGTYQATLTVDAGPLAGSRSIPVTLTVTPAPPPPVPVPVVSAIVNAASLQSGPLVAGSLATIFGSNLAGNSITVTFDGVEASLFYTSATQINLQVPVELAGRTSAQLVVTAAGQASAPQTVTLAVVAPAIFANGVLNQDNTVNGPAHPAPVGSVIQIFATGLSSPGSGAISARIHGVDIFTPYYAGPAPTVPGVQQVNIVVPADFPAMIASVQVCAVGSDPSQRVCSPKAELVISRP